MALPRCHSGEACASTRGPGIQAVREMPWEGVDSDCVWIDPASYLVWDGLFPQGVDSGAPVADATSPE